MKICKMVISVVGKIGGGSMQLCRRYEAAESSIRGNGIRFATSYLHHSHHMQRRAYALFNSKVAGRPKNAKFAHFTYSTISSSSSSSRFLKWYLSMLETHPFITKGISSSLIFAAADATSQMITLAPSDTYDKVRALRIALYGFVIMGPSQHLWFNFIPKMYPERDVRSTLKKIAMGQTVYGPIMNSIFFSYNAALRGETKEDILARIKRDLLPTLKSGLMYWPLCDFLTLKFVPVHLQPLANSSFAYFWTIYLTYMASLKKAADK